MRVFASILLLAAMLPALAPASIRLLVTVVEQKTAKPVTDLKAGDFTVIDGGSPRRVEAAEYRVAPVDVMLLVDSSLVGQAVQAAANDLIGQLQEKEQMALVAFHSSADMVQEFTSSKSALQRALADIKYGNEPRVLDGVYAAADGGFANAVLRKVILLLTTGMDGGSRITEREILQLCRKNGVSIYPLYLTSRERGLFEMLARNTGGVAMSMREIEKAAKPPSSRVFEAIRGNYTLTLSGNLRTTEKLKIELNRQGKYSISALQID